MGKVDYLSNLFASRILAHKIQAYWHNRGHTYVKTRVEKEDFGGVPVYVVRSNIRLIYT